MDQDQVLLLSEQRGQADGAVGALQLVVADRLVGQPAPQVGQFLLRLFEFLVGGRELLIELGVGMGHRFLLAKIGSAFPVLSSRSLVTGCQLPGRRSAIMQAHNRQPISSLHSP